MTDHAERILRKICDSSYVDWLQDVENDAWVIREPRILIIDGHTHNLTAEEVQWLEQAFERWWPKDTDAA